MDIRANKRFKSFNISFMESERNKSLLNTLNKLVRLHHIDSWFFRTYLCRRCQKVGKTKL
jgi:hypothetical protein